MRFAQPQKKWALPFKTRNPSCSYLGDTENQGTLLNRLNTLLVLVALCQAMLGTRPALAEPIRPDANSLVVSFDPVEPGVRKEIEKSTKPLGQRLDEWSRRSRNGLNLDSAMR